MKEILVLGVVALLTAAGGGTWYAVLVAPSPPGAAPVAPPRPAPLATPPVAKAEPRRPDTVSVVHGPVDSTPPATARSAPPPVPGPDQVLAERAQRAKAVGKILAGMKPKEAADILNRLPDDEVERIVRQLNAKQVAALLTALPDDRAAALSRRLLETGVNR